MKVLIRKAVLQSVEQIAEYIVKDIKMPDTAVRYTERLLAFGFSLGNHPYAYPLCRNLKLARYQFHCAVFEKKWIFVYKISSKSVVVHRIIWGGQMK